MTHIGMRKIMLNHNTHHCKRRTVRGALKKKTYLIQKRNGFSIGSEVEDNCVLLKLGAYFKLCSDAVNPEVKDAKIWLCSMKYSFKDIIGSILWVINALLASQ